MNLKGGLSNYILKVTSSNFKRKKKIQEANKPVDLLLNGTAVIASELYLALISIPTYLLVDEKDLKKHGYDEKGVKVYKLRKRISLSSFAIGAVTLIARFGFVALTSVWLGKYLGVSANLVNYDLAVKDDYSISKSIQITDGMAVLKKDKKKEKDGDVCFGSLEVEDALYVDNLDSWTGFTEVVDPGEGHVVYQLSLDNKSSWLYWNGSSWVNASEDVVDEQFNTAQEISDNVSKIDSSNNSINIKAILYGSCAGDVKLLGMGLSYDLKKEMLARRLLNDSVPEFSTDDITNSDNISVVEGVNGGALLFNGEGGSYIVKDTEANLVPGQVSVSIWVNPHERETSKIVDKGGWKSPYGITQDKWSGWTAYLKTEDGDYKLQSGDDYMKFDEWNLITMTYDSSVFKLYVNEDLVKSVSASGLVESNNSSIYIGSETDSTKYLNGAVDDFRLYNYALSDADISELYSHIGNVSIVEEETPVEVEYSDSVVFNLNEGSGLVSDDTTEAVQLDLLGAVWSDGIDGMAVYLDSYGDKISTDIDFLNRDQTVLSFWYKEDKDNTGGLLKLKKEDGSNLFYLGYTSLNADVESWNNVVVSLQSGNVEVFLNGEVVSGLQEIFRNEDWTSLEIGGDDVAIDEIRFYNKDLSPTLLEQLSEEYKGKSIYNIVGELEGVSFVNENENEVSETESYIALKKDGKIFAELSLSADLLTEDIVADLSENKSILHFNNKEGIDTVKLLLAKTNPDAGLRVCPGAQGLEDVKVGCSGEIILSKDVLTDGVYTLVDIDDSEYWHLTASIDDFGTGIEEFEYGLVAYWDMDSVEGSVQVDNKNDLVATEQLDIQYAEGKKLDAAAFENGLNGPFDYFYSVAHSPVLNLGNSGSVCTWVYLEEAIKYQGLIHKGGSGDFSDAEYSLQTFNTGKEFIFNVVGDDAEDYYVSTRPKSLDTWYYVCGTYSHEGSNTDVNIYVDGVLEDSDNFSMSPRFLDGSLQIGSQLAETSTWQGSKYGKFGMNGLLDEVRIYNVALTESQINTLMEDVDIANIEILSPSDGEYVSGSIMNISWNADSVSGVYDIQYSTDGFNNFVDVIAEEISGTDYSWDIPEGINGEVEIRVVDSLDNSIYDVSEGYITILDPVPDSEIIWRFDEASGCSFSDDSGTYIGSLGNDCQSESPEWTDDGFGTSALLYSEDAYSSIPNSKIFNPITGLTLSAWVKWEEEPSESDSWAQIISKNGDDQYQIQHNKENTSFEFALKTDKGRKFIIGDTQPVIGEWYMVTATYDGENMKLYVNGQLDAQAKHSGNILSSDEPILLGKHATRGRNFGGIIDEFRFLNYAMDESDISYNYIIDLNHKPVLEVLGSTYDSGFVDIEYSLQDIDNDYISLSVFEYSLDDGNTWHQMSASGNSEDHSGTSGLLGDSDAEQYVFVWDSVRDLGNIYEQNVLVRLQANDSLVDSDVSSSEPFDIDSLPPTLDNIRVSQRTTDGKVVVSFQMEEQSSSTVFVSIAASSDLGNNWDIDMNNVVGNIGELLINNISDEYEFIWDVKADYPGNDVTNLQIKISVSDGLSNEEDYFTSVFAIDTKSPFGISNLVASANSEYSAVLTWSPVEQENNFDRYQILYSVDPADLDNMSVVMEYSDEMLFDISSHAALITDLEADQKYYFKVIAWDKYQNSTELPVVSMTTLKEIDIDKIVLSADSVLSNQNEVLVYGVTVPNEYVTLTINGDVFEEWAFSDMYGYFEKIIDFEEGDYELQAKYSDVARNIVSEVLNISIDTTPPSVSTLDMEVTDELGYVNLSGVADADQEILIYIGDELYDVQNIFADVDGNWSQEIFVSEEMFGKLVSVVVRDLVGNMSVKSNSVLLPSFEEQEEISIVTAEGGLDVGEISLNALNTADVGDIIEESVSNQIFAYSVSRLVDTPEVLSVNQSQASGNVVFGGKGVPNSEIILFVHSDEAFAVKAAVDESGYWSYTHKPEELVLENGDHEVYAVAVDEDSGVRSRSSNVMNFAVDISPIALVLGYIDIPTTIVALVILAVAVFLVIYSRNKFKTVNYGKK